MHKYTWLVVITAFSIGLNNRLIFPSNKKNESFFSSPQSLLISAMQSNLQQSVDCSKKNILTPFLTHFYYGNFFKKATCEIDFLKKQERVGNIRFSCQRTNDPKVQSVFIEYLCVKDCYRNQGVGRLIMIQLMQFFKKRAYSTKKSIIFHLTSATISELPVWCGQCNFSIKDQQTIRKKFYTNLGLKELPPSFSLSEMFEWLEYTIFGEPVNFGAFFVTSPSHKLPEPYTNQNFSKINITKNKQLNQFFSQHMHQFFKQLKLYFLPFFAKKTKNLSPSIYPFISQNFTFNKDTQESHLISLSYAVNAYPPQGCRTLFPLINASRTSEKTEWNIKQESTPFSEINNLQKSFSTSLILKQE